MGQEDDPKAIERDLRTVFKADSALRLVILGEDHDKNNTEHKLKIVQLLQEEFDFSYVGIELPRSMEPKINAFISGKTDKLDKQLAKSNPHNETDFVLLFNGLRAINQALPVGKKIKVICFDIESADGKHMFDGLNYFLTDYAQEDVHTLDSLLRKRSKEKAEIARVIGQLKAELETNKKHYEDVFGEQQQQLDDIIEDIEVLNFYGLSIFNDSLLAKREALLVKVLDRELTQNDQLKMVVFCGQDHASLLETDEPGSPIPMSYQLKYQKGWQLLTFYTLYYNHRLTLVDRVFGDYISLLDQKCLQVFTEHPDMKYTVLSKEQLKSSNELYIRCDGVLIKNCFGRKR